MRYWVGLVIFVGFFSLPVVVSAADAEDEFTVREWPAECIPVTVSGPDDLGPGVAVVKTRVKPSKTRVYLDGRFVGRAILLDGQPDYLYLRPGSYRLELKYGGYRTEAFLIEVGENPCRFDIKHRMERIQGEPKEKTQGKAVLMGGRIWGPPETSP